MTPKTNHHIPKISYKVPLDGVASQGAANADRPLCAMTRALSSYIAGNPLGGQLRGADATACNNLLRDFADDEGVPMPRMTAWAKALNGGTLGDKQGDHPLDREFAGLTLSDYQVRVVLNTTTAGGVHAMGCGLGKTITAVATAAHAERLQLAASDRCWIVCPLNAKPAWERMEFLLKQSFAEVKVLSMDSAHKFADADRRKGGVIIFDEVHLLGSAAARRTQACHRLRAAFDFGLCLTGTLLHSGVEKIMSILDLAVPGGAMFSNKWTMGRHFNCLVTKKLGGRMVHSLARPYDTATKDSFFKYLSSVCQILKVDSPEVVRNIGAIPQTIHDINFDNGNVDLPTLAAEIAVEYYNKEGEYPHASYIRMHLLSDKDNLTVKLDWLKDQMHGNELPVVLFDTFTANIEAVEAWCQDESLSYVRVDGSVTGKDRAECERKFREGEARVFIGQTKAASVSMNLQTAYISVTLSPGQSAADYDQSLCRTARRGQTKQCHHFNLSSNPLQSKVYKLLQSGRDFDSEASEWQELRATFNTPIGDICV